MTTGYSNSWTVQTDTGFIHTKVFCTAIGNEGWITEIKGMGSPGKIADNSSVSIWKNLKNHYTSQFELTTGALQPEEAALQLKPSQTLPFTHWHHSSALFWPCFCLWLLWKCYAILTFLVWSERMKNIGVSSAYCWQWLLETWLNNLLWYSVVTFHS